MKRLCEYADSQQLNPVIVQFTPYSHAYLLLYSVCFHTEYAHMNHPKNEWKKGK